ncbi:MAG: GNAT family N-acetyltransferase [Panacibacter sp.]
MISKATIKDIPALVRLVNSAYRGEASKKGWTTEANSLQGEFRTDEAMLLEQFNNKDTTLLKFTGDDGNIDGCVCLQKHDGRIYLGMLSVDPNTQARGIGKTLLLASEEFANEKQCSAIYMTVISLRHELIEWYKRHGYLATGETKPFPTDERFGIPTQHLEFIVLEKQMER